MDEDILEVSIEGDPFGWWVLLQQLTQWLVPLSESCLAVASRLENTTKNKLLDRCKS